MSLASLDELDALPEDVQVFNEKGCRVRIEASKFGRAYWIVPDGDKFTREGEAIFHASEITKLMANVEMAPQIAMIKSKFTAEMR